MLAGSPSWTSVQVYCQVHLVLVGEKSHGPGVTAVSCSAQQISTRRNLAELLADSVQNELDSSGNTVSRQTVQEKETVHWERS